METWELILRICLTGLPFLDLLRVYGLNWLIKRNKEKRRAFLQSLEDLLCDWSVVGIKMCWMAALICNSILQITLKFMYHKDKKDFIIFLILGLFSLSIRIQYTMLLNYDSKFYGHTTTNSKITFLICLLCQSSNFILSNEDKICKFVEASESVLLLLGFLILIVLPKDYRIKNVVLEEYKYQQSLRESKVSSTVLPFEQVYSRALIQNKNQNLSAVSFSESHNNQFINQDNLIKDVSIKTFKESQQYDKRTIIYQIDYRINNKQRTVYRSFREFLSFHSDLKYDNPTLALPQFPSKKQLSRFLTVQDIKQRQEILDIFLKGILIRFNNNSYLRQFFNVLNDTVQYKQQNKTKKKISRMTQQSRGKNSTDKSLTYASIPETIWEGDEDSIEEDRKDKRIARSQERVKVSYSSNPQDVQQNEDLVSRTYDDYYYERTSPQRIKIEDEEDLFHSSDLSPQ